MVRERISAARGRDNKRRQARRRRGRKVITFQCSVPARRPCGGSIETKRTFHSSKGYNDNYAGRRAVKGFAIAVCLSSVLWAGGPELDHARKLYDQTAFDQSLEILRAMPEKDATVQALIGRNCYMQGEYKKATEALEKAFAADPQNAEYALWLGRSFGRRAETASPFTAPGYA